MKKTLPIIVIFVVAILFAPSCKSKQQITDISGGQTQATAMTTQPAVADKPTLEITRNESFTLAAGEANTDVLSYKYHVVVGSFKSQSNAKGLQSSLNAEGNKAVVVVNETGMFRVLLASYNEYSQARARITQVSNRFPDSWVLVQK